MLSNFFVWNIDPGLLIYGRYNLGLVVLSIFVAAFSSTMGMQAAFSARRIAQRGLRLATRLAGSLALGGGVWAMHFIGMLSFELCTYVDYTPGITALSFLPGAAAAWIALGLVSQASISRQELLTGGCLVGAGIGAMHYSGMAAMTMAPSLRYDPFMFGLSIVVAVGLAVVALWVRFGLVSLFPGRSELFQTAISGSVMGLAIAGMHYTGMAAAKFVGAADLPSPVSAHEATTMALLITLITVIASVLVAATTTASRYRELARELRAKESRLKASEDQFRTLIRNIPGISYRCRYAPGWPVVFASDAVTHITGHKPSDFLGMHPAVRFADLVHPDEVERINRLIKAAIVESRPFVLEFQMRHKDGSTRWIWGSGSAVSNSEGHIEWVDGVLLDITERRDMEEALREAKQRAEQAAQARSAFLANMSHEIRTPMNAILGFTDVVLGGELKAEQRRHLETVQRSARALLHLLNDILDSSKLDRGALQLEKLPFSLPDLVQQLCAEQSIQAGHKHLLLRSELSPDIGPTVEGDPHRLRQVLLNLLGNAIKFTEQGEVRISAERRGETVHFAVSDTGIGIAPERLSVIFDAFTQADASMSRRYGGTGLGTTISKQLVELMQGRIWVESQLGQGSTFHIELPLPVCNSNVPQPMRATLQAVTLPPLRILVADDVVQNAELLTILLGRLGHTVHVVHNGQEVLDRMADTPVDLVLMDIQMPVMDGLTATRAIRAQAEKNDQIANTPVIGLSASVQQADRQAALAAGMNGFASKPVELATLLQEMARVLKLETAGLCSIAPMGEDLSPLSPLPPHDASLVAMSKGCEVWGDRRAYARALGRFAHDESWCLSEPARQSSPADAETCRTEAHRLKGLAANLRLTRLEQAAQKAERLAHRGETPEDLADAWSDLVHALRLTVAEAATAAQTLAPEDGPEPGSDAVAVWSDAQATTVQSLARLLRQGFQRSERPEPAFTDFCEQVRPFVAAGKLNQLENTIDEFDFDAALAGLESVLQDLPPLENDHAPL